MGKDLNKELNEGLESEDFDEKKFKADLDGLVAKDTEDNEYEEEAVDTEEEEESSEIVDEEETEYVEPSNEDWEGKAKELGWYPAFKGDPLKYVGPKEFVQRQGLYDEIDKQKRRASKSEKRLDALYEHQKGLKEASDKRAIEILRAERIEAINEGRGEDVVRLEEEEKKLEEDSLGLSNDLGTVAIGSTTDKELEKYAEQWITEEGNEWFSKNPKMADYANGVGRRLSEENPDLSMEEFFKLVTKETKELFEPNKTEIEKTKDKPKRSAVSKTSRRTSGAESSNKRKLTMGDLPPEVRKIANQIIKSKSNPGGVMSKEEYLDSPNLREKYL